MALLEVRHLHKTFGNLTVLDDVSFSVGEGEVLAVIGSSGGGKTTLLRCLNLLEIPDSGSITVGGETIFSSEDDYDRTAVQRHMGLVFQQFNLFPQYDVLGNLTLAPKLAAKRKTTSETPQEIEARARMLLKKTGLEEKAGAYPCMLSGGQQQRVAIARALMLSPTVLCFDEPTSALDPELAGEVVKVIRDLRADGRTMILVTHDMHLAVNVADRVIFVADGSILEEGTPEELLGHPKNEKTRNFLSVIRQES